MNDPRPYRDPSSFGPARGRASVVHTARFKFGANVVIQVLLYRLSFTFRQIIAKECNDSLALVATSPIRDDANWK